MQIIIQSPHLKLKEDIVQLIQSKVKYFEKINNRISKCLVLLRKERNDRHREFCVQIELRAGNTVLFASEQERSFEIALHKVVEDLASQLRRYKNESEEIW